jgi:hypothetical protein
MVMLSLLAWLAVMQDVKADPVCHAEVRWATAPAVVSRAMPLRGLTLFSAVSQPPVCAPAEIRLTVAYFDAADQLVCSGEMTDVAPQTAATQVTALEVRPMNLLEFLRWRNGPAATASRVRTLRCTNGDGTALVQPAELESAVTVRMYASVLAKYGGIATAELQFTIQP